MSVGAGRRLESATQEPVLLLTGEDRAWISDVFAEEVADPGRVTAKQLAGMGRRERARFDGARANFLLRVPLLETSVVARVMGDLRLHAKSAIRSDLHQQDLLILNGEPGVGKTMMLKTHAAEEMRRLALQRSLALEDGTAEAVGTFRPVLYAHLRGPMTRNGLIRLLCEQLNWPTDSDPLPGFTRAIAQCGVQLVIIDEIQHVNFDGATGRHVHNIIRWMSNSGLRVVLGGTDVHWVLNGGGVPAVDAAARNSRGRWIRVEVPKLELRTVGERDAWLDLVFSFEQRLRLVHAPMQDGWLADALGVYMWVRTQGYLNSLILLISRAAAMAIESGVESIDREMLDRIDLQYEVERQRSQRMTMFDAGTYPIIDPE